jgi:hypothetical protein
MIRQEGREGRKERGMLKRRGREIALFGGRGGKREEDYKWNSPLPLD